MSRDEIHVGMGVVYQPHPDAPREDGVVTELRERGAMVRYSADGCHGVAKLTPVEMLQPLAVSS